MTNGKYYAIKNFGINTYINLKIVRRKALYVYMRIFYTANPIVL